MKTMHTAGQLRGLGSKDMMSQDQVNIAEGQRTMPVTRMTMMNMPPAEDEAVSVALRLGILGKMKRPIFHHRPLAKTARDQVVGANVMTVHLQARFLRPELTVTAVKTDHHDAAASQPKTV